MEGLLPSSQSAAAVSSGGGLVVLAGLAGGAAKMDSESAPSSWRPAGLYASDLAGHRRRVAAASGAQACRCFGAGG